MACGLRNQDLEFKALGFCQEDGGKSAIDLWRYYDKIITESGMKSVIYDKARSIISDSLAAQRQGSTNKNVIFVYRMLLP